MPLVETVHGIHSVTKSRRSVGVEEKRTAVNMVKREPGIRLQVTTSSDDELRVAKAKAKSEKQKARQQKGC